MEGLEVAVNQLQSSQNDVALLLFCDLLENVSGSESYYLAAFVVRNLTQAIEQNKKIYASIPLLYKTNTGFSDLAANYRAQNLATSSVNLFTLESRGSNLAAASITELSAVFVKNISEVKGNRKQGSLESWCALQMPTENDINHSANGVSSLVNTIVSIQQRRFLPIPNPPLIEQLHLKGSPFYLNLTDRPWFHPQIHPQFRNISPQPSYIPSLRRAALHVIEKDGTAYHMVAEEFEDVEEVKHRNLQPEWPCEIFVFFAKSAYQLIDYLHSIEAFVIKNGDRVNLKDLAFTVDSHTAKAINEFLSSTNGLSQQKKTEYLRAAFVCSSIEDLLLKLKA